MCRKGKIMYTQQNKAAQQQQKQPFINEKERDRARQQKKKNAAHTHQLYEGHLSHFYLYLAAGSTLF